MTKPLTVLIIEDHPIIIEGYSNALKNLEDTHERLQFSIYSATNIDSANRKIEDLRDRRPVDLVILDISLPPSKNGEMTSGEDLGVKLRDIFWNVKIIVATMLTNNHRLLNIIKSFNPEGFLVKSEMTSPVFMEAILSIINDTPFYSRSVLKLIRAHVSNDTYLDTQDRTMLFQLSQGTKTKSLPEIINLSMSAIERRKHLLHIAFNTEGKSDKELIRVAREKGFL